jgi:hypothetical protein
MGTASWRGPARQELPVLRLIAVTLMTVTLHASAALAQFQIDWYTIDGSGGSSASGGFSLTGTIGQHDAGAAAGGAFECGGRFWGDSSGAPPCHANFDGSTTPPVLNVSDFTCFVNAFATGCS